MIRTSGVSPTVAVILMVAVTVLLSAGVFFTVTDTTKNLGGDTPTAGFQSALDDSGCVGLTPVSGDKIDSNITNLTFVLSNSGKSATLSLPINSSTITSEDYAGDNIFNNSHSHSGLIVTGGRWSVGETARICLNRSLAQNSSISVSVVDSETDTLVSKVDVQSRTDSVSASSTTQSETISWDLASDSGSGSDVVVDGSSIRLGYSTSETGLVGYWSLDGTSGDVDDVSPYSHTGTLQGDTSRGQTGILGSNSFGFDGSGDYVNFSATTAIPSGAETYALVAWFKSGPGDCVCGIVGWGNWGTSNETNALRLRAAGASTEVSFRHYWWGNDLDATTTTPYGGNWHLVVAQYDASTREIWLDGTKVASDSTSGHNAKLTDTNIGVTYGNEYFNGSIDEVRVYNRSLSSGEVSQLYSGVTNGSYTTEWKTYSKSVDGNTLTLSNVTASLNGGNVSVYVETDTNGDGSVDDTSNEIVLNGSSSYDVSGVSSKSDTYRLRVQLKTNTITSSPTLSTMELQYGG